jgi:hypothetical protein
MNKRYSKQVLKIVSDAKKYALRLSKDGWTKEDCARALVSMDEAEKVKKEVALRRKKEPRK